MEGFIWKPNWWLEDCKLLSLKSLRKWSSGQSCVYIKMLIRIDNIWDYWMQSWTVHTWCRSWSKCLLNFQCEVVWLSQEHLAWSSLWPRWIRLGLRHRIYLIFRNSRMVGRSINNTGSLHPKQYLQLRHGYFQILCRIGLDEELQRIWRFGFWLQQYRCPVGNKFINVIYLWLRLFHICWYRSHNLEWDVWSRDIIGEWHWNCSRFCNQQIRMCWGMHPLSFIYRTM